MFKDKVKLYQVYHAILSSALTWALVLVINQYFNLKVPIILTIIFSVVPGVLIYLFDRNKKNLISYLLLISIIPLLALVFWMTRTNPITWLRDILHWCRIYDGTPELYVAGKAYIVLLFVTLLGAIICYLIIKNQITKYLLAAILMVTMIVLSIGKININKAVVGIVLFFIMTILVELYGIIYNRKSGKQEKKEGILYLAPICLLLSILAISLPSKPEPIEWKAFKLLYKNVKEQLEVWGTDLNYYLGNSKSEFFVSLTGYSEENGELQTEGKLVKDNKIAMKLAGMDKGKSLYLTGSVSDIYTGNSWDKSREDFLKGEVDYLLDYGEMFFALTRQAKEVVENNKLLERRTIEVEYNNIKTKTFFYPLKMSWYKMITEDKKLTDETPQINFKKARGKGTAYQLVFYEMNLENEAFRQMLRDADGFSYDSSPKLEIDPVTFEYIDYNVLFHDNVREFVERKDFYEVLGRRAEMINQRYTSLPDTVPQRVYDLAEKITADYHNDYDKLKAIEEYLTTNYNYTFEVDKIPEGADFTDYFLFESKKGYCTYYATAMAVLGRCIGLPTRYVEGFLGKFKVRDEDYMYLVDNSQAHAWAEAYIEGIGWIPFEATTPFYGSRYRSWPTPKKQSTDNKPGTYSSYEESYQPPLLNQEEEVVILEDNKSEELLGGVVFLVTAILVLLLIMVIYYNFLRYRYGKRFEKSDDNQKVYLLFLRILSKLKREGFVLEDQETILMLAERMKDKCYYGQATFMEIADIFMRYRYAQEKMTALDLEKVKQYYKGLQQKEREEVGRLKLWMEEFLFLAKS